MVLQQPARGSTDKRRLPSSRLVSEPRVRDMVSETGGHGLRENICMTARVESRAATRASDRRDRRGQDPTDGGVRGVLGRTTTDECGSVGISA
jgi:hypothetical protein